MYRSFSRCEIYEAIWAETKSATAKKLGVSARALTQACTYHHIPVPSAGYWTLVHMGRRPAPTPLPQVSSGASQMVVFIGDEFAPTALALRRNRVERLEKRIALMEEAKQRATVREQRAAERQQRPRRVFELLCAGMSRTEAARALGVSRTTLDKAESQAYDYGRACGISYRALHMIFQPRPQGEQPGCICRKLLQQTGDFSGTSDRAIELRGGGESCSDGVLPRRGRCDSV